MPCQPVRRLVVLIGIAGVLLPASPLASGASPRNSAHTAERRLERGAHLPLAGGRCLRNQRAHERQ